MSSLALSGILDVLIFIDFLEETLLMPFRIYLGDISRGVVFCFQNQKSYRQTLIIL